jgi:hypothetical protein
MVWQCGVGQCKGREGDAGRGKFRQVDARYGKWWLCATSTEAAGLMKEKKLVVRERMEWEGEVQAQKTQSRCVFATSKGVRAGVVPERIE